ncbi:glycoside hydrolase family 15 protein [Nitrosomonas aestuarii]|uniref:glycoside hydrolase family 15 protein n=1 Tax=Nitrosomonas aestuarii TaxID=52441 RepID=UPI000D30587C|nr:glycoside hydrolase family 15 protein [Nitrosomonas aestuarii]PTN08255.1 glucoamylase [Nitrosomonas aestuarii]
MQAPQAAFSHSTWAPAGKDIVGTSLGSSRLWFTAAEGIVTEIYYPRVDIPQIRDLGFIIADDKGFWVELRRLGNYRVNLPKPYVPAVEIVHRHPRFTFTLKICPSQHRDVLLLHCQLEGDADLRPYALLSSRLGGDAENNQAFYSEHNGRKILWAMQGPFSLALMANRETGVDAWKRCSVGCIGESDGWQDFNRHGRMTWEYDSAGPGSVALMGELPNQATLALGFGTSMGSAATLAISTLFEGFSGIWDKQCCAWEAWFKNCHLPDLPHDLQQKLALSSMVLKVHEDRTFCGAMVASLAIPWGEDSQSRGGYHLVWCRDLVETAGALVAMGSVEDARNVLRYLIATQQADGHWLQNQWLGGKAFWQGIQLDEAAFPVLLASALRECKGLVDIPCTDMVTRALRFIAREGPVTGQDRWEEDSGVNTFTLSVAIAALVEGSTFLDGETREFALLLADNWNARLEEWTFVADTSLARQLGVTGYYMRITPDDMLVHDGTHSEHVLIKNRAFDPGLSADEQIATDFLQLVRYGLRRADDSHIIDSLKVVDRLLKTDTPNGSVWHRYNGDGYGEHEDGSAFDGTGCGRGWPLLTGERGHYALLAGEDPLSYLKAMATMTGTGGLLPEQVWDSAPIPERHLNPGKPSGSAMPLVWAHSEFIKLCYSRALGYPVDRPIATWNRYRGKRPEITHDLWGPRYHPRNIQAGNVLTIALKAPARVHWGINSWKDVQDMNTKNTGLDVYVVELPVAGLKAGETVQFTFYWLDQEKWEDTEYEVLITE